MVSEAAFIEVTDLYTQIKMGLYEIKTWGYSLCVGRQDRSATCHPSSVYSNVHYEKLVKFRRYCRE